MNRLLNSGHFWLLLSALFVGAAFGLSVTFWGWLITNSETLRNTGFLVAGGLAFFFAVWRARVAERQADAARDQAEYAQRQADTAQHSLLNERYQRGAEMLGSSVPSVRLAGVYALDRLAREYPDQYHVQIMNLLCAYVRSSTKIELDQYGRTSIQETLIPMLGEDIQAALTTIGKRGVANLEIEKAGGFKPNFDGADLSLATLSNANLMGASFQGTKLKLASLVEGDLTWCSLMDANFEGARLDGAKLGDSSLTGTNFSQARMARADLPGAALLLTNFTETNLQKSNLSNATIMEANFTGALLEEANFSGARLTNNTRITQNQLDLGIL